MDAAAPSRRAGPRRDRPLIPPNYVSLRDLQELRLKEQAERRRRQEEEEAAARREAEQEEEERRLRKEAEEQAAARRAKEEEAVAARRVRDAAAAAEMKGSSSSSRAPFRYNERPRAGPRGEGSALNSGGAAGGSKGPGGDAADGTLGGGGGGRARDEGKGKASAGLIAGDPAETATSGKPNEKSNGEASGCQGTALGTSSVPGELAEVDTASYRGGVKPRYKNKGKKGFDGRSTETAMTGSLVEVVKASPPRVVDSENKGNAGSSNQSTGKASASSQGEAAEDSPLQGVKSDNKWNKKNKPSGGRQAGAPPSGDWPNRRRDQPRPSAEGSRGRRNGDGQGAVWEVKSDGLGGKQPEVEGKAHSHLPTESSSNRRRGSGQGMTRKGKFEDSGEKELVVEMRAHPHPAADSSSYQSSSGDQGMAGKARSEDFGDKQPVGRSSGDQGMNQEAKSERFEEKQSAVEMRAVKTYRGQRPGGCSRVNGTTRQPGSIWVPKAAAVPVRTEVGNIP
ncbi:hypothetical protein VPH35_067498 [Triticum aestivum]|uniref:translation initiation factor IF-2 n=1 Tax=Triticum aestivum TaxID=4565 RepID=UPI000843A60A|nr:translation initiation factor IF-2-like [Triticum aestivum]